MGESKVHRYVGKDAVVTWDEGVCRHAAECVHGLPDVFDPNARPWIAAHAATFDALAATIARCPSGALTLLHPDGTLAVASGESRPAPTAAPEATLLKVRPNGPNVITGDFIVDGVAGVRSKPGVSAVLCRCGASANKPFCDGTHMRTGFKDAGLLPADALPGTLPPGAVTITPTANGPLECRGPLTVQGANGQTTASEETWLCRCGHSQTKPFCDGSHERVGFKS